MKIGWTLKLWCKALGTRTISMMLRILWVVPVRSGRFLFLSYDGKQYSDSPKYISEYIEQYYGQAELLWALLEPEQFSEIAGRGVKIVRRNSFSFLRAIASAEFIITNNYLPAYIPIRKDQVLLNTWHGGSPLKTVGFCEAQCDPYNKYYYRIQNPKTTAFLSSSQFVTEQVLGESFHYSGTVLPFGMPRNAILLRPHEAVVEKVYRYFNLEQGPGTGIVLYAPTFRGDFRSASFLPPEQQFDIDKCVETLNRRFHKQFTFLFRAHHTMTDGLKAGSYILATDYPDMQELLCAADILITDYSSCMGDMALMYKPVFLYTPDLEDYVSDRGFYWDIHTLPFPLAASNDEFYEQITRFDEQAYRNGVEDYLHKLGCYETADSTKKTVEWLFHRANGGTTQ